MNKKNTLVIYGYDRIVPPFMQTLIHIAINVFDEIVYVTPTMPSRYYEVIKNPKVRIITWSKRQRLAQWICGFCSILRPSLWNEIKKGNITMSAIKNAMTLFFCSDGFLNISISYLKYLMKRNDNIFMLGTWMGVDAFTIARLKKKYPHLKAFSLAHSGEVIAERNPYMHQCFHEYIFTNMDQVYFISRNVLKDYLVAMSDIRLKERFTDKISSKYLGSLKSSDNLNPLNTSDSFTILSCSRVDENKRLHKIITTLSKWRGIKLRWIHIGTGVLYESIYLQALEMSTKNKNVEVVFTGSLDNKDVIDFYEKNPVDIFINVSKSEGLPIAIMEAMSYGIPCIATNVGGSSEIVNFDNGYLLNKDFRDDELLNILQEYCGLSESQKQSFRKNAYEMWNKNFNARNNAMQLYRSWLLL